MKRSTDKQRLDWCLKEMSQDGGVVFEGKWTRKAIDAAMRAEKGSK